MSKKKIVCLVVFLLAMAFKYALSAESRIALREAAFVHASERYRQVYGDVGRNTQIEGAIQLTDALDAWGNLDWTTDSRDSSSCGGTRANIATISFGIKGLYTFNDVLTLYGGAGPCFGRIWLRNHLQEGTEALSKIAFGGVLKTGVHCSIVGGLFLDLFVDYLYQPIKFETTVDLGGLKIGGGVGYRF